MPRLRGHPITGTPSTMVVFILCYLNFPCVLGEMFSVPLVKVTSPGQASEEASFLSGQENNLHGQPGFGYYVQVGIGTPPQVLNILCDTGSSNFAVASNSDFDLETFYNASRSPTYKSSGKPVSVTYTQGYWKGTLAQDKVMLPSLEHVSATVNIACINSSTNFFLNGSHWQGIMGLAYEHIAKPDSQTKTFFQSLVDEAGINNTFALQLCGSEETSNTTTSLNVSGSLTLGGIDKNLYSGDMMWTPIHKEWYYEVVIADISVDDKSLGLDCKEYNFDKTIVDSGTTNLRFPETVFDVVVKEIKRNIDVHSYSRDIPELFWDGIDLLCWPPGKTPYHLFPDLRIHLAESENKTFALNLSPERYLRLVRENYDPLTPEDCYKFAISPSTSGTVIGAVVMEGYYVAFDKENRRIGFAKTICNARADNDQTSISESQTYLSGVSTFDCAFVKPEDHGSTLMTVAYVMAGICGACFIPLILMVVQWQWTRCRRTQTDEHSDNSGLLTETDIR